MGEMVWERELSLDDGPGICNRGRRGSLDLVVGESCAESPLSWRSFKTSPRRCRAPGNPSSGGANVSRFRLSWKGAGLTSLDLLTDGGGESEIVGDGGTGPAEELETNSGPGISRYRGNVGVAATTPIFGT